MPASSIGPEHRDGTIRVDSQADGILAVCLDGDFDVANAPVLRGHIDSALDTGHDLIVDLSQATFIDSTVVTVLFAGAEAADRRNKTVVLQVATAPVVERVLELVAIERVLRRAHSRTEAVQMIQREAASRRTSRQ